MMESTYKGRPMRYFLIDRLAAGFDEKSVCHQFRMFFEVGDTDEQIMGIFTDIAERDALIEERKQQLIEEIDKTNITGLILKQLKRLDEKSDETDEINDLVKITNVFAASLVSLREKKDVQPAPNKQINVNYYNQFNATFLTDLEGQGIIKILDQEKFSKLFLTAAPPPEQLRVVSPPQPEPVPEKKKRAREAGPDDIAAFL